MGEIIIFLTGFAAGFLLCGLMTRRTLEKMQATISTIKEEILWLSKG